MVSGELSICDYISSGDVICTDTSLLTTLLPGKFIFRPHPVGQRGIGMSCHVVDILCRPRPTITLKYIRFRANGCHW